MKEKKKSNVEPVHIGLALEIQYFVKLYTHIIFFVKYVYNND